MTTEFFNFLNERHRVYVKKERGDPWPWTTDPILRAWKFTNVYRDLDAVSKDCKRQVLDGYRPWKRERAADLVADVVTYRLFNLPATWRRLAPARDPWRENKARRILSDALARGAQIFTGAYIVSNMASKRPKVDIVCEAVTVAHEVAPRIVAAIRSDRTLQHATATIQRLVPGAGAFVAYEIVSDLRWTPLLANASDIYTWANAGPGAVRGLNRIHGRPVKQGLSPARAVAEMRALLVESQRPGVLGKHMRPLEMRDVEHSLCEFDKHERVRLGEGKPRSRYRPPNGRRAAA